MSSGTGFDEEAALLGAGREFALMKTASGKVHFYFIIHTSSLQKHFI